MPSPEPAFQEHVSGLLVPPAHVRQRQVFTKAEWKMLHRVSTLFHARGLRLEMECENPACTQPIQPITVPGDGMVLRCQCTDRVLQKAF